MGSVRRPCPRTSMMSHAWSTSLRVGGTRTLTAVPSAVASAVSAMRSSKSAICDGKCVQAMLRSCRSGRACTPFCHQVGKGVLHKPQVVILTTPTLLCRSGPWAGCTQSLACRERRPCNEGKAPCPCSGKTARAGIVRAMQHILQHAAEAGACMWVQARYYYQHSRIAKGLVT